MSRGTVLGQRIPYHQGVLGTYPQGPQSRVEDGMVGFEAAKPRGVGDIRYERKQAGFIKDAIEDPTRLLIDL